jgi:ketosteroid isomerase-like protein
MSRENVEVVRRAYQAFVEDDLAALLSEFAPDVVSYTAPPLPDPAEYHGHDGLMQWIGNWTEGFDEFAMEVEGYTDAGDDVVVQATQRATGAVSGVPTESRFWFLNTVREDKITRIGVHATEAEALEAVGLRE